MLWRMPIQWDLHYDRRVSEGFLAHFLDGGVAHSLVEYARHAPYPLDLQMRHNPKTGAEHATLYVGLTSVVDVERVGDKLRLKAHKTHQSGPYGFSASWLTPMTVQQLSRSWRMVENYLEKIIPDAAAKHASQEGAVQAAASVFSSSERIMVDREVALHFRDTPTKSRIFREETGPFLDAVQNVDGVPGAPPSSFGGECDLLALDARGRLLAVEVKPRGTGSIVWSTAQATVYARLLDRWVRTAPAGTDTPVQVLRGMLDQRTRLGLAPPGRPDVADAPVVVPVVAIQRGANDKYLERMRAVQAALVQRGCGDPALEVYEVSMAGRLDPLF